MRTLLTLAIALSLGAPLATHYVHAADKALATIDVDIYKYTFIVKGMVTDDDADTVTSILLRLENVKSASVDLGTGAAKIVMNPEKKLDKDDVEDALEKIGFKVDSFHEHKLEIDE